MSWLSFLSPLWALMGLIAIPIILLYILRQKRPDMPISSTLLWSKTLADMRASTPFQKLRRHLLLLLQLLILAALVLTLMRPVVQAQASQSEAGVIVIDATASMQTHDDGASESRLDRAKIEAKTLVDRMRPGDRYMLIADGGGMTQVRSGFTSSKSELKSLIDSVKSSDTPSDLSESLLLAATSLRAIGGGNSGGSDTGAPKDLALTPGQVWLFSDGAGIRVPDAMGDKNSLLRFVQIGSSDHSVGITRLSITPVPKQAGAYEVFVGIKNAWPVEKKIGVTLAAGTKENLLPDQAKFVTIPPGGTSGVAFENVTAPPGKIFALLDDADDDFPLDNVAFGIIEPLRKVRVVLITRGNEFLEHYLQTEVDLGTIEGQVLSPDFYNPAAPADLFILDEFLPSNDRLPHVDTLLVRPNVVSHGDGKPVDVAGFLVSHEIRSPTILRWRREDPLLQHLELGDLRIYNALLMDKDPSAVELVSAPEGPLIAFKDFGAVRRTFISFSPMLESNWCRLSSMLIFMRNAVNQARERHFIGMPQLVPSGNPARLWAGSAPADAKAQVLLPSGDALELPAKDGVADFGNTDQLGFYEVLWPADAPGGAPHKSLFAVNLLNPTESDIRPQALQTATGGNVLTATSVARVNREIWRWLALAALVVLFLEWWAYHRRVT